MYVSICRFIFSPPKNGREYKKFFRFFDLCALLYISLEFFLMQIVFKTLVNLI